MTALSFDGTWEGMLTAAFTLFELGIASEPVELTRPEAERPLFADRDLDVVTDSAKADRVWAGLRQRLMPAALAALTGSFLSEDPAMDSPTLRFIVKVFTSPPGSRPELDLAHPDVLAVVRTAQAVRREAHRMLQFVRFQKAADGTYFAMTDPRHNVLPMALDHFVNRFADQHFILYDHRRGFGYFYDGSEPRIITLPDSLPHIATGFLPTELQDPSEQLFQRLWRTYFKAVAIPQRLNPRKQRADMPVRYWRYLTEKNG